MTLIGPRVTLFVPRVTLFGRPRDASRDASPATLTA
jgi:hypothetical protein